jgi:trimeric autotransporter adhesin
MKEYYLPAFALFAFICFALLPTAQAETPLVLPAPDGAYPGFNTAEGLNALFSRTTGAWDTAIGAQALYHDTTGTANTALGYNALFNNIGGGGNTANGTFTLFSNTSGASNTALGNSALYRNLDGHSNTAMGPSALHENIHGSFNVGIGQAALAGNTVSGNTAVGYQALTSNTSGAQNAAVGFQALAAGSNSNALGYQALFSSTTGDSNNATGFQALFLNTSGVWNEAYGYQALFSNITGNFNTAIGDSAGFNILHDSNIDIGNAVYGTGTDDHVTRIGQATGTDKQVKCYIGGIYQVTTGSGTTLPVIVDNNGQLGTTSSSVRFKHDIKPMDKTSDAILALKPVTFHYKSDNTGTPQFGLIAEEVAKVNPNLVVRDDKGDIYTVRYDAVNAMLLNEFLKEHRKVEKLEKQIEALTAGLQKVSDQIEMSKPAPQTVLNNQ